MDPKYETARRLRIAQDLAKQIKPFTKAIVLGGSMGYGMNYSLRENSDIDLVVIFDKNQLDGLLSKEYFKEFDLSEPIELIKKEQAGFFWVTKFIQDVEVNIFMYEMNAYVNYCLFRKKIIGYRKEGTKTNGKGYLFDGTLIEFDQNVRKFGKGYLYEKPILFEGKYWNAVPRNDFICSYHILHEKDNFWKELELKVWREIVKLLIKEYGNKPDLDKVGPIYSHWVYQNSPERLPLGFIEKVKNKTKEEIYYITKL